MLLRLMHIVLIRPHLTWVVACKGVFLVVVVFIRWKIAVRGCAVLQTLNIKHEVDINIHGLHWLEDSCLQVHCNTQVYQHFQKSRTVCSEILAPFCLNSLLRRFIHISLIAVIGI